ncbi:MAG: 30S ribosomal protein S6 [Epsilonproteobacteria bacterium]|nr:30S ribosomal protein S6 [Campylobacterota bacterium]
MMQRYETLMLAGTEITDDELSSLEALFDKKLGAVQGKLSLFDKWGKYRLAYPVNKNGYGIYVFLRYELPKEGAQVLHELDKDIKIKFNEIILRHVTIKLAKDAPSTYHKPESVDSAANGSIDSFIKENKIENLLQSVDATTSTSQEEQETQAQAGPVAHTSSISAPTPDEHGQTADSSSESESDSESDER